jgi:hypothetical protein
LKHVIRRLLWQRPAALPDLNQKPPSANACDDTDAAVAYFERTLDVHGLVRAGDVLQLIADYAGEKRVWHAALLDETKQLRETGLPIYESLAGPLEAGLDWTRLPPSRDRLYRLRPHRFGFLPRLAMAAACGANALPTILATLDRWIAAAGRLAEDAYFSNLVVIYRIVAITWAAPFCVALARAGQPTAATICLRLYQILAADIQYVAARLGDSAPNNHLLSDRFAAWLLAMCYPDLYPHTDITSLEQVWYEELSRQFDSDGTNFEQSAHYHDLGCEMAVGYLIISLRTGRHPDHLVLTHIARMLRFQSALTDARGICFALGDATDDPLLPLDAASGWGGGTWRALYNSLFDPTSPGIADGARGAERAFWLRAALPRSQPELRVTEKYPLANMAVFPNGGYVTFRDGPDEQLVLFRTGPSPGTETHAGHAMSDLLSIYWTLRGQPVLEPSGTYTYEIGPGRGDGPKGPRDYFRSPAASNGVLLHGHDPLGGATGRFRGGDNGTRVATRHRFLDRIMGWAEGRLAEAGPLNGHTRGILHLPGLYTLAYDRAPLLPPGARISYRWQFAPEAQVDAREARQAIARMPGGACFVSIGGDVANVECVQGRQDPPAGWISRGYGRVQAAPQLVIEPAISARDLVWVFGTLADAERPPSVKIAQAHENGLVVELLCDGSRHIACIGGGTGNLPFDIDFQGDVIWLDVADGVCREIRGLGISHLRSAALGLEFTNATMTESNSWRLTERNSGHDRVSARWRRC